jgi:hypothetical protein
MSKNIIFASITVNAHGSSLIGGSAKLITAVDRSTYLFQVIDKMLHLHDTDLSRANAHPTDSSTFPRSFEEDDAADLPTETVVSNTF